MTTNPQTGRTPVALTNLADAPSGALGAASTDARADRVHPADRLHAEGVTIGYDDRVISADLDVSIPDGSFTVMPSGAIDVCGRRPRRRATSFAGIDEIERPSSTTCPRDGLSRRDSARSSVDLPHAFGPTITVNDPSGMLTSRSEEMTRSS